MRDLLLPSSREVLAEGLCWPPHLAVFPPILHLVDLTTGSFPVLTAVVLCNTRELTSEHINPSRVTAGGNEIACYGCYRRPRHDRCYGKLDRLVLAETRA